ncbi:MAG: CotH kinase family protein, partial [Bryobacteraceae bacterium]
EFVASISDFVDLRVLAKHLAIENFVGELDGILGYAGMNNFYMYRFAGTNFSRFIPWDKDVTFNLFEHYVLYNLDQNVLVRRMMEVPELRQAYFDGLRDAGEVAGGAGGWLEQEIDRIYWQIRAAALEDPVKQCVAPDGGMMDCTNEQFEGEVSHLRTFAQQRRRSVLAQLSAAGAQ